MASEAEMSETAIRNLSVFLPLILGITTSQNQDQEAGDRIRDRTVFINPVTQSMIVIEGSGNLDALFHELMTSKDGPLPASKASIDAMPTVEISENGECVICLEEYGVGEKAREMPCKHRFHSGCIEKWLGIHGSCPVCRFKMPVEDREEEKKSSGGGEDGEGRGRREIRVGIWVGPGGGSRAFDLGSDRAGESGDSNSSSGLDENGEDGVDF